LEKVGDRLALRLEILSKESIVLHESEVVHCIERLFEENSLQGMAYRGALDSRERRVRDFARFAELANCQGGV
jgi:hypothetical protein